MNVYLRMQNKKKEIKETQQAPLHKQLHAYNTGL